MFTITIEDQNGQVADTFSFDHGSYVVGRSDDCDVVLPSHSVSRQHARIFIQNGRCFLEDLGSANGAFVDGQRVVGTRDLGTASQIRIGDFYLYLEFQRPAQLQNQDVRSTLFIDSGSEHNKLVRINDAFAGEEFSLSEQENTIGRTDDNFILLSHTSVSRRHAVIIRHGDFYAVQDLQSANGTRVNGKIVQERKELHPGDRVEFGEVEFAFVEGHQTINAADYSGPQRSQDKLITYATVAVLLLVGLALGGAAVLGVFKLSQDKDPPAISSADLLHNQIDLLLETGSRQLRLGNWDAASAAFDEALDLSPQNPEALRLREQVALERDGADLLTRAAALNEQGRHSEARQLLLEIPPETLAAQRAAPTLDHVNRTVTFNLKTEANRMLRRDDADLLEIHQRFVQALTISPDDDELRDSIATVEERLTKAGKTFQPYQR